MENELDGSKADVIFFFFLNPSTGISIYPY